MCKTVGHDNYIMGGLNVTLFLISISFILSLLMVTFCRITDWCQNVQ